MEAMYSHQPLSPESLRAKCRNCQQLFQLQDQLTLKGGLLYRKYIGADGKLLRLQLVVLMVLRKDILRDLHEGAVGGHVAEEKSREWLKERFYWPGHWGDGAERVRFVHKQRQQCESNFAKKSSMISKFTASHLQWETKYGYSTLQFLMDKLASSIVHGMGRIGCWSACRR